MNEDDVNDQKKLWTKPQLTVLGRVTPEEQVLKACKQVSGKAGPASGNCHASSRACKANGPS